MTDDQLDNALRETFADFDALDLFLHRRVPELRHREIVSKHDAYWDVRRKAIERATLLGCRDRLEQALVSYQLEGGAGPAVPIPEAVDRHLQWMGWDKQYRATRQSKPGAVQIYILPHHDSLDVPSAFVKRIKAHFERLARAQRESAIRYPAIITWDDCTEQNAIREEYRIKLFQKLNVPDEDLPERSAKALREHIQRSRYVFIEQRIQAGEFEERLAPFLRWLATEYWSEYVSEDQAVLLFVHLQYGEPPSPDRHAQLTSEVAFNAGCPVTVLPALGAVTEANLRTWVGEYTDVNVDEEVTALAKGAQSMRMLHVIKSIENWQRKRRQERQA